MEWAKGYAEKYIEVKEGIADIVSCSFKSFQDS
jgi:hypothetical protein